MRSKFQKKLDLRFGVGFFFEIMGFPSTLLLVETTIPAGEK
jgi:hypothetical protein